MVEATLTDLIAALAARLGEELRNIDGGGGSGSGSADTAKKLETARKISLTGAVEGSGEFDGSADLSIATAAAVTCYTDPTNFGSSLDKTLAEIWLDLPSNSLFWRLMADFTNPGEVPYNDFCTVFMLKGTSGNRGGVWVIGKDSSHGDWRCYLTGDEELNQSKWYRVVLTTSASVGSGTNPTYLDGGVVAASSSTVGSTTKPVYLNSGTITATNDFVTLSSAQSNMAASLALGDVSTMADFVTAVQDNSYGAYLNGMFVRFRDTTGWTGFSTNTWMGGYVLGQNKYGGTYSVHMRGIFWEQSSTHCYQYHIGGTELSDLTYSRALVCDDSNSSSFTVGAATKWNGASKTTGTGSPNGGSAGDIHFQYIN